MLSEDAKHIVASNLTVAKAILITSGYTEKGNNDKPPVNMIIDAWMQEFLKD